MRRARLDGQDHFDQLELRRTLGELALATRRAVAMEGLLSGAVGHLISLFLSFPVGANQTVVAGALVVLAVPVRPLRGSE